MDLISLHRRSSIPARSPDEAESTAAFDADVKENIGLPDPFLYSQSAGVGGGGGGRLVFGKAVDESMPLCALVRYTNAQIISAGPTETRH